MICCKRPSYRLDYRDLVIVNKQLNESICRIKCSENKIGFFCSIEFPDYFNLLNILVTESNVLENKNTIEFILNNNKSYKIIIDNERKIYKNKESNICFIEIKQNEIKDVSFLFVHQRENFRFLKEIYILYYSKNLIANYKEGKIKNLEHNIYKYKLRSNADIFSCAPIIDSFSKKVIGFNSLSKEEKKDDNELYGNIIFINDLIEEFIKEDRKYKPNLNKNIINNQINEITIKYNNSDKDIYGHNSDQFRSIFNENLMKYKLFGDKFVEANKSICKVININNNKEYELSSIIEDLYKNQNIEIKLRWENEIHDLSYMFCGCISLISVSNFSSLNTDNVINMSAMFSGCKNLVSISDIGNLNTKNVQNMSGIFYKCKSLKSLPNISNWETSNVKNMKGMFFKCKYLLSLPDISKWNTKNVIDMSYMFKRCSSLALLPDISKWNTSKIVSFNGIFEDCSSLLCLPDISKWNLKNVIDMNSMFCGCKSLSSLPDISKWDTNNVIDMGDMFYKCISLSSFPNINKWNVDNINKIGSMFYYCISLSSAVNINQIKNKNIDQKKQFYGCINIIE